jgi:hypothetical protein
MELFVPARSRCHEPFLLAFLAGLMLGGCALVEQGRWKSGGHGQIRCHGARC